MLKQQINFYACIGLISAFGVLVSLTVIQSVNKHAAILAHVSSPIQIDIEE